MKTLLVLAALAAVALAAPTLPEKGLEDFKKLTNLPETVKRERKSIQESITSDVASGAPATLPSTSHVSEFGVSGRSFGLTKPIIIKKKPVGYQVYRDSDEVPAESGETCGSQVKVKFCDGKATLKSSKMADTNTQEMEEDMKHSITLAKEALENVQRDLNIVEKKPGTQASSWNHGHSESDAELHQDIEVAREALEHIHKNFGNFESMSLHPTTLKETAVVPEATFAIAKTEEQRLAQWKEAIDTIQKNVEIAKNIEDTFRMEAGGETGSMIADDMMMEKNKHELNKKTDLRTSEEAVKQENKIESENCKTELAHETKSIKNKSTQDGLVEDDMASSASTISEKKMNEDQMRQMPQMLSETKIDQSKKMETSLEGAHKEKNAANVDAMALNNLSLESMKSVEDKKAMDEMVSLAESTDSVAVSTTRMKSIESEDMLMENQKKAAASTESLEKMDSNEENHPKSKSAENFDEQLNNKNKKDEKIQTDLHTVQSKQIDTTLFAKSAEEGLTNTQEELMSATKLQKNMGAHKPEKHLNVAKMVNNEDQKTQHEILASINDAEQMEMQQQQSMFHPEMRTTEDMKNMHQQLMMNPETRWADDKNMQLQRETMQQSHGIHSHSVQHPGHTHHVSHSMNSHNFEIPSSHGLHSRFSEQFMTQEKSADTDMQAYMSMRDGAGLAPENHRFHWKPTHEAPRTAYGAPAAPAASVPSGGAIGLFPNANLGNCGIPLLLSCNPSVVSGSLAKPAPVPYSAPSYRTEDNLTFLTKRDVKKNYEKLPLHRAPKPNLKTNTVLVAKH